MGFGDMDDWWIGGVRRVGGLLKGFGGAEVGLGEGWEGWEKVFVLEGRLSNGLLRVLSGGWMDGGWPKAGTA